MQSSSKWINNMIMNQHTGSKILLGMPHTHTTTSKPYVKNLRSVMDPRQANTQAQISPEQYQT